MKCSRTRRDAGWRATTRMLAVATLVLLAAPAAAQDDREARGFIDRIAGGIFETAWVTATYQQLNLRSIARASDGYDATVRLSGVNALGAPLWLDLVIILRDGRLADMRVIGHNAILMEPFGTAKAIGAFIADLAESYAQSQAGPSAHEASARPAYTLRVANACHLGISVWLRYRTPTGEWVTNGNWDVAGLSHLDLHVGSGDATEQLEVGSRVVYSYAEPILSDTRLRWSGDRSVTFGDRTLAMRTDTLREDGSGSLVLSRTCPNVRRLGIAGADAERYEYGGKVYTAGARIERVEPGYPAQRVGLQRGDVIYNINGQQVANWESLLRYIVRFTSDPLTIHLIRGERNLRFAIPADPDR